jgi:hypothetical protein
MRSWLKGAVVAAGAAAAVLILLLTPNTGQAQQAKTNYKAPRTKDGKPNLNGIYQAMNTANWNIEPHGAGFPVEPKLGAMFAVPAGLGIVEGGEIPYLPAAKAKRDENFKNRIQMDPENKCYMPGVPRAAYMPYPFQIIQGNKDIMFVYEYAGAVRVINMGTPTKPPADSWMGWSNGRWDGETLVIDVIGNNANTWFDRAGNHHSDQLHVVERYTARSPETLTYEATIEDPATFSRPWKMSTPLYRHVEPNAQLLEFKCVVFAEELLYGHLRKGAPDSKGKDSKSK